MTASPGEVQPAGVVRAVDRVCSALQSLRRTLAPGNIALLD
jgi:hypothetical protein